MRVLILIVATWLIAGSNYARTFKLSACRSTECNLKFAIKAEGNSKKYFLIKGDKKLKFKKKFKRPKAIKKDLRTFDGLTFSRFGFFVPQISALFNEAYASFLFCVDNNRAPPLAIS